MTRSTDICTCARLLPDVYRSLERKSRRERSLCHLQIISMINCSGNKIPLTCVFAAIAIVFIHGLSLAVAPGEPEVREPEARAWATAENEPITKDGAVWATSWSLKRGARSGRARTGAGAKASPATPCTTTAATVAAITKATNLVATTPETPVTWILSASVGRRFLPWARITRF